MIRWTSDDDSDSAAGTAYELLGPVGGGLGGTTGDPPPLPPPPLPPPPQELRSKAQIMSNRVFERII
jgi:hypothetical protein